MSEKLKEAILAKCLERGDNTQWGEKIAGVRTKVAAGEYEIQRHINNSFTHIAVGEDTPANDPVWLQAAQILGIQIPADQQEDPLDDKNGPPFFGSDHPVAKVPHGNYGKRQMYESYLHGWDMAHRAMNSTRSDNVWIEWMNEGAKTNG